MQDRRVSMRGGRARSSVPEPMPVDDSTFWSSQEPAPATPGYHAATPDVQAPETYVKRVWNLAKGTVTDLLGMSASSPPRMQRRLEGEGERGYVRPARDSPRHRREENSAFSVASTAEGHAAVPATPLSHASNLATAATAPTTAANASANAPATSLSTAGAAAPNITVYQFYASPAPPSFYPTVPAQTASIARLSTAPDLFVPRVSVLSRPVLSHAGQKRVRGQDRSLNVLDVAPLTLRPTPTAAAQTAPTPATATFNAAQSAPFSVKPALGTPFASTPAPPVVPKANGFFNAGPPVDIPVEDGFASDADNSDDDKVHPKAATPKPTLNFGAPSTATAPSNPFTFGVSSAPAKPAFGSTPAAAAAAAAAAPAAPAAAPKTNSFFNSGPPVDIPVEDGFASGADDSDDDNDAKAEAPKPAFTFGAPSPSASATPAASSPFTFGNSSAPAKPAFGSTPAAAAPAAPAAAPKTNSFFNSGPPVDIPVEDGFASGADDSDDDNDAKAEAPKPAFTFGAPTPSAPSTLAPSNPFSFGSSGSAAVKPAFGGSPAPAPSSTASPFSFGSAAPPTAVKPAFGSGTTAPAWGMPTASGATAGEKKDGDAKPAAPLFSFGM